MIVLVQTKVGTKLSVCNNQTIKARKNCAFPTKNSQNEPKQPDFAPKSTKTAKNL